jgi:glycosyltransferase involved in cell wall biosynthesis
MKRIVFDCERMKYPNTGIYSYCYQLGKHLIELTDPKEEQLTYFTPQTVNGIFGKGYNYITQNSIQKWWSPNLKEYTLWHATYQNSDYIPSSNNKIKVVLTIHDLNFLYDQNLHVLKKKRYLNRLQANIDRSSAIVCISDFSKNDVLNYCKTKDKPVYVIHNGTNILETPVLFGNSYQPRTRFLFSIGTVNRKKNFHVLLPLLQSNNDVELLIAGIPDDPDYIHYIQDSAKELGVQEKVRVLGPITEKEKSWYYQNCYAFTLPSLAEGFGLPVAEAMSVGKPLFLSDKTALPEIGRDVAFYFKNFNSESMHEVFVKGMQQYKNEGMEELIKERSSAFCWEKTAMQYLQIYRSI